MYEHILLAVALQHGDMPSPHALAARDAAAALAKGPGAQLSVLTVYRYPDFVLSALALEAQGRYRQSQIQQTDATAHQQVERWLEQVQGLHREAQEFLASHPSEDLETALKALEIALGSLHEVAERYE